MIIPALLRFDDCIQPLAGAIVTSSSGAIVVAALMIWLSVAQFRRKRLRYVVLAVFLVLGVALSVWAGRAAASEPVLVSGKLNLGQAFGLALFSLWLALIAARARKRGPIHSAVLFCYGAALLVGATAGWTWRAFQPCKHHYTSLR